MTCHEVLQELESLGTEQNRKIYQKHGVNREVYGVSFANLEKIRKRIKKDHALARELWETGKSGALIAIGGSNERLTERALAAAAKIGRVEVDHGETGCKTPEAAGYIRKMLARKKK